MLRTRMTSKHVQQLTHNRHRVRVARSRNVACHSGLNPGHCVQIQNLNSRIADRPIVTAKQIDLPTHTRHRMTCARGRVHATGLRSRPAQRFCEWTRLLAVLLTTRAARQNIHVRQPLGTIMAAVDEQLVVENHRRVIVSRRRCVGRNLNLGPGFRLKIENMNIVQSLTTVPPTEHYYTIL